MGRIIITFAAALLLLSGCKGGSVGDEPISRCVPEGQCDESMFQTGLGRGEANVERGRALYEASCATCHGPGGEGQDATAEIDFTRRVWHAGWSDEEIAEAIQKGRPPEMPPMPLAEGQLRDVIAFLRSLKEETPEPTGGAPGYGGGE